MDLGLLVERPTRQSLGAFGQQCVGTLRLGQSGVPVALELHDLRAVHPALAAKRHQLRLRRTPLVEGRRPLVDSFEIVNLLAGQNHRAVDDACRDGCHLAGGHGDHGLIEQRRPVVDALHLYQRLPVAQNGEGQ